MNAPEYAVVASRLTKAFGHVMAVEDLDLLVKFGEVFGLLGPDGAGKTTTVRLLSTLLKPTSGSASVAGYDVVSEGDKVRRTIGIVSEGVMLYKDLTIEENLKYLGKLYDLPSGAAEKRIFELLEMFGLEEKGKRLFSAISTGMAKKVMICAALLHGPRILLLDEVTAGLDPQTAIAFRDFARRLRDQGVTVIWTTHYMEEPEQICDRVGVLFAGRLVQVGTPDELRNSIERPFVLEFLSPGLTPTQIRMMEGLTGAIKVTYDDDILRITGNEEDNLIERAAKTLLMSGARIKSINTRRATLEEAFNQLTRQQRGEYSDGKGTFSQDT
jgi:ABC-2 type transport system ATP-binding protein